MQLNVIIHLRESEYNHNLLKKSKSYYQRHADS